MTETACTTEARHDAVEKGRTMPVVPRIEMPAEDAQPRVGGLAGHQLAAGHRHDDADATGGEVDDLADRLRDHRPGHRVDGGLADLEPEPGLGHDAHADPALQHDPGRLVPGDRRGQVRAVGDVGVVAGVLDHDRLRAVRVVRARLDREGHAPAAGQADLDDLLGRLVAQRRVAAFAAGRGAGARGPAGAQRRRPDLGRTRQVRLAQLGGLAHPRPSRRTRRAARSALRNPWK
jgi:hypothetical protein